MYARDANPYSKGEFVHGVAAALSLSLEDKVRLGAAWLFGIDRPGS